MAGFNFEKGRSNNMVEAEESRGKITIGRWAKKINVSARAAIAVMQPTEAHHTGTGRRGKSQLTSVIDADLVPTTDQVAAMRAWDAGEWPAVRGWFVHWEKDYDGRGRRHNVPYVGLYEGDAKDAPRKMTFLTDAEFARAKIYEGKQLAPFARYYDDVCEAD